MTTAQPVQPAPASRPVVWTHARIMYLIATVFFVIAALCAAFSEVRGELGPQWAWGFGAFAAWTMAGWVP